MSFARLILVVTLAVAARQKQQIISKDLHWSDKFLAIFFPNRAKSKATTATTTVSPGTNRTSAKPSDIATKMMSLGNVDMTDRCHCPGDLLDYPDNNDPVCGGRWSSQKHINGLGVKSNREMRC